MQDQAVGLGLGLSLGLDLMMVMMHACSTHECQPPHPRTQVLVGDEGLLERLVDGHEGPVVVRVEQHARRRDIVVCTGVVGRCMNGACAVSPLMARSNHYVGSAGRLIVYTTKANGRVGWFDGIWTVDALRNRW